ncbi:hypothetical protein KCU67_g2599, partial [Aureobasidium melanogenum]
MGADNERHDYRRRDSFRDADFQPPRRMQSRYLGDFDDDRYNSRSRVRYRDDGFKDASPSHDHSRDSPDMDPPFTIRVVAGEAPKEAESDDDELYVEEADEGADIESVLGSTKEDHMEELEGDEDDNDPDINADDEEPVQRHRQNPLLVRSSVSCLAIRQP